MGECGHPNCRKNCEDLDDQEARTYHARITITQTHLTDYTRRKKAVTDGGVHHGD